jgi:hypothetical protein
MAGVAAGDGTDSFTQVRHAKDDKAAIVERSLGLRCSVVERGCGVLKSVEEGLSSLILVRDR